MFGKLNLANMVLDGVSRSISINPQRCSRIKHKSSPCTACHMHCPVDAITVGGPGTTIRVDWEKCTGCGICVNVCPSQAYTLRHNGYKQIIDNCCSAVSPDGILRISCAQAETALGSNIATMECMGILNVVDIIALYLKGARKIIFQCGDCGECESRSGEKILLKEIDELKQLSGIFEDLNGLKVETLGVETIIELPKQKPIVRPKVEDKPNPTVDRRGLFSFLTQNLKDSALKSASMMTVEKLEPRTIISFEQYLPSRRKLFLNSVMELGGLISAEAATGRLFNDLTIDSSCVYCGMCNKFCPTSALKMNEEKTAITFNASKCTSCMLCQKACYHNKLRYKDELLLKDFFTDVTVVSKEEKGE